MKTFRLLSLLCTAVPVLAAGVAIHATIVSRIHGGLPEDIRGQDYLPYLIGGAFFPDAFYGCGIGQHNTSEHMHWPPFLKSAVEYYRQVQSQLKPKEALQLKAFIYGVFTHQAADSSWHSLGMHEGLLELLQHMDFAGDEDQAHRYLDTAGDFLHLWRVGQYDYFETPLKLPDTVQILDLLKKEGLTVSPTELFYCFRRGQTALNAEIRVANAAGPAQAETSPLLNDILDDYFLGGIEEIAGSLQRCIPNLDRWLTYGPTEDPWTLCGSIIENSLQVESEMTVLRQSGLMISPYTPLSQFGASIAVGNFLNEPSLAIGAPYEESSGSVYVLALKDFLKSATGVESSIFRSSSSGFEYSKRFGSNVATYSLLGHDFTLVSEPGTSNLYIYSGNDRVLTISDSRATSRFGVYGFKQQNSVISTYDIDGDGLTDIFIGSPFADADGPQSGEAIVLSGDYVAALVLDAQGIQEVDVSILEVSKFKLPEEFKLSDGYEQFGASIAIDSQFVYIAANGVGAVFVYSHDCQFKHTIQKKVIDDVAPVRRTSRESGRFGANWIITGSLHDSTNYLIIGEHANGRLGNPLLGAIYFYIVGRDGSISFHAMVNPELTFASSFCTFGYTAVVHDDYIFVSAPGYDNFRGAIYKVSIRDVLSSAERDQQATEIFLVGEDGYSGFGETLEAYGDHLIVGEAKFGFSDLMDQSRKLTGRVGIYEIS